MVVNGTAIRFIRTRRDRNEGADKAHLDAALKLFRGGIGVVDIEHGDALQPARVWFAEIGVPVVVDAADLGQQLAVRDAVPKEALARLQHRAPDPVLLVFGDHCVSVIGAFSDILPEAEKIDLRGVFEALPGLHDGPESADLHAAEHPGVIFPAARGLAALHLRRAVAEPRLDAPGIHIRRLNDMGIRRDQLVLRHDRPPPISPTADVRTVGPAMRLVKRPPSVRLRAQSPLGTTAAIAVCQVAHSIGDSPAHLCHLGVKIEAYDLTEDGEVRSTGISRGNRRRVYPGSKRSVEKRRGWARNTKTSVIPERGRSPRVRNP